MKQVIRKGLSEILVDEVPDPLLVPHHVLVQPACSLISSGTETASIHRDGLIKEVADNPSHLQKVWTVMKTVGPAATLAEIRARLGADYIMTGVVRRASGRWMLSADVSRATDRTSIWGENFTISPDQQTVAVEGRDRHIGSSAAIGFDPRDAPLIERALAHLIDEAHTLDHIATRTAQIHGLSWPNAVGEFDDRHPGATPGQPEGQCRSRDSGSADQDGRLRHGRQGSR